MDDLQKLRKENQMGPWQKILPLMRKAFRPTHFVALIIGLAIGNWVTMEAAISLASKHYQQGIEHGHKKALSLNPVSAELEYVCAGLWFNGQDKK